MTTAVFGGLTVILSEAKNFAATVILSEAKNLAAIVIQTVRKISSFVEQVNT